MSGDVRRNLSDQATRVYGDPFLRRLTVESIELAERSASEISGRKPSRVLELGSAGGIVSRLRPSWITADVVPSDEVRVLLPQGGELPFADDSFDLIFMQDTLHHIQDLDRFATEITRTLDVGVFCFVVNLTGGL
jgi:SAM-dependent methyltransferase